MADRSPDDCDWPDAKTGETGGGSVRHDQIRQRAYQIWEESGRPEGHEMDHWLEAEREVLGRGAADSRVAMRTGAGLNPNQPGRYSAAGGAGDRRRTARRHRATSRPRRRAPRPAVGHPVSIGSVGSRAHSWREAS